ncbi:DUF1615 domain-containing protein [Corallococcus exiguus]|uniref:DUF1615 domain-containing protein n=1 Tax=Corallococcus TaxID=83461 RepID=UPI000EC39778|nr:MULTISPECIES: DUF1615 domain-containing protein [Corallococcus]NNB88133.1 DUF1615 domain-containing protein [Corallococcus exiguus]NNB95972.1 DUF1615 domain-containing protein [Corallococcus exiguus]RKH84273.1 DUF1615 domain-containing protein [Corallococcus sp. AB032C]
MTRNAGRRWTGGLCVGVLLALTACASRAPVVTEVPAPPTLSVAQVARLLPAKVKGAEREGWAGDVLAALDAEAIPAAAPEVCQVLAIIEQESGFQADPAVPGLPRMVRQKLDGTAGRLGPLGRRLLEDVLAAKPKGAKRTFGARLDTLRTERDLDRLFRDMLAYYEAEYPAAYAAADLASSLFGPSSFAGQNPVTTAGSMQVSVRYAVRKAGPDEDPVAVRESLYTRAGGVRYGTARLLGFEAAYDAPLYRFADYNSGVYSSRNAALQAQVSRLTGVALATDGDLQLYDKEGEPRGEDSQSLKALLLFRQRYAPDLSERRVRRDVEEEKTADFEKTDTYLAVKRVYANRTGQAPAYAQLPQVTLKSVKLSGERSTAWFAKSVDARYQQCMARHRQPAR